jgi:hypothetical protein
MADLVAVRVRACECPGTPHEGDVVFVTPTPSLQCGLQAQADIIAAAGNGTTLAASWQVTFVKYGAVGWNLVDEDGDPVPFDVGVLLADYGIAAPVGERCDELYGDAVMRPLLARLKNISRSGSTGGSTSATTPPTPLRRKRSSPATSAASKRSAG